MQSGVREIQKGRSIRKFLGAIFQIRHYRAFKNIFAYHTAPLDFLLRYLFHFGTYPHEQKLKNEGAILSIWVYSWHDILTVNEIFFRTDYPVVGDEKTIVDFGSNIGISAAFFLSRCSRAFCYLFEPLPANLSRLRQNLKNFEGQFRLEAAAVALADGEASFGYEDSGRYGGIGVTTGSYLKVPCVDAVRVLKEIMDKHGEIDVLKIDIEALENEILAAIPTEILRRTRNIFIEQSYRSNPLQRTHRYVQFGSVAHFLLVDRKAAVA